MGNVIRSVGYALGKLHTGMIVYLCDLWNEGTKEPLESFLSALGITLDGVDCLDAQPEYQGIDLVIWEKSQSCALAMIEMKVDDHEHDVAYKALANGKGPQTMIYPRIAEQEKWNCKHYLFVTLGAGEFYDKPAGHHPQGKFQWIRIQEFAKALDAVKTDDRAINDWRDAVHEEMQLQETAFRGEKNGWCNGKYRSATWNLYLLGGLKDKLALPSIRVYAYGQRPDTILNFGWARKPYYMEINHEGKLNLKVWFEDMPTAEKKQQYEKAQTYYFTLLEQICKGKNFREDEEWPKIKKGCFRNTKSNTILSITDFGLASQNGHLYYVEPRKDTHEILTEIVKLFSEKPLPT